MRYSNSDLNKWFTRLRKRLGGPPCFKRGKSRTYWNCEGRVHFAIGITAFDKAHTDDSMCIGFGCWVAVDFDIADHWRAFYFNIDHAGMLLERYVGPETGLGSYRVFSDNTFMINDHSQGHLEEQFASLYSSYIVPWFEQFKTQEDVLEQLRAELSYVEFLPFTFTPDAVAETRVKVGKYFLTQPNRQPEPFADWLASKTIVSAEECSEIKKASIQRDDHCTERISRLGYAMAETPAQQ